MRVVILLIAAGVLTAVGALGMSMKKLPTYRFSYTAKFYPRPYQTELLLEVNSVRDIDEKTPGLDSPSIIKLHFTKEAEAVSSTGQKIAIKFTDYDFKKVGGLAVGDRIATFGMEDPNPTLYRIEKFSGGSDKAEEWFRALK